MEKSREERIEAYINSEKKSGTTAFLLALLFGPVGYLYASPLGGAILILVTVGLFSVAGIVGAVFAWLFALSFAPFQAAEHNKKLRAKAELMAGD